MSKEVLCKQAHLSIAKRVADLDKNYNILINICLLQAVYKRNKICFRACDYHYSRKTQIAEDLKKQQKAVSIELLNFHYNNSNHLYYLDETSVNMW